MKTTQEVRGGIGGGWGKAGEQVGCKSNKIGQELTIVKARWWVHGGTLFSPILYIFELLH